MASAVAAVKHLKWMEMVIVAAALMTVAVMMVVMTVLAVAEKRSWAMVMAWATSRKSTQSMNKTAMNSI